MENSGEYLKQAIQKLQIADHMVYVTFPLIHDNRLLLKIFDELYYSLKNMILALKEFDHYEGDWENYVSVEGIKKYGFRHDSAKKVDEIILVYKRHKESAMEFPRQDKVVIMSDNLGIDILDLVRIKRYLLFVKEFFVNIHKILDPQ